MTNHYCPYCERVTEHDGQACQDCLCCCCYPEDGEWCDHCSLFVRGGNAT